MMNAQNGTTGETGKPTAAEHAWLDAIRQRRNVRQLTDRLVPGDDLDQILKAGRTVPTPQNSQQSTDPSTSTSWSSGSHLARGGELAELTADRLDLRRPVQAPAPGPARRAGSSTGSGAMTITIWLAAVRRSRNTVTKPF
jgi:hypothetical protein